MHTCSISCYIIYWSIWPLTVLYILMVAQMDTVSFFLCYISCIQLLQCIERVIQYLYWMAGLVYHVAIPCTPHNKDNHTSIWAKLYASNVLNTFYSKAPCFSLRANISLNYHNVSQSYLLYRSLVLFMIHVQTESHCNTLATASLPLLKCVSFFNKVLQTWSVFKNAGIN